MLARPYHAHPRPVLVETEVPRLPMGIASGVKIVVTLGRLAAAFLDGAERPERQMVTHKMQTVSHSHEYSLKLIGGYELRIADSVFDAKLP